MQTRISQQKILAPTKATTKPADIEYENTKINHRPKISKRVRAQKRKPNNDRIVFFAENETADIPDLTIKSRRERGLGGANMHLQLD